MTNDEKAEACVDAFKPLADVAAKALEKPKPPMVEVCLLCGEPWEVDSNGYPLCCKEAQAWADANGIKPE